MNKMRFKEMQIRKVIVIDREKFALHNDLVEDVGVIPPNSFNVYMLHGICESCDFTLHIYLVIIGILRTS